MSQEWERGYKLEWGKSDEGWGGKEQRRTGAQREGEQRKWMSLEDIKIMWAPQKLGVLKGVTFKYVTQYWGKWGNSACSWAYAKCINSANIYWAPTVYQTWAGHGRWWGGSRMGFRCRATSSRLEARVREGPTSRMQPGKASWRRRRMSRFEARTKPDPRGPRSCMWQNALTVWCKYRVSEAPAFFLWRDPTRCK